MISRDGFEAMKCFERMQSEGLSPDVISFHLHFKGSHILQRGFLTKNTHLGCSLVYMYAICSDPVKVEQVLAKLPSKTIVAWNAHITGYIQGGKAYDAIKCIILVHLICICSRLAICCKNLRQVYYLAEYVYEMWLFRRGTQCVQKLPLQHIV